ncbi:Protein of unknown function, partial [Gryllus bimaculatus]
DKYHKDESHKIDKHWSNNNEKGHFHDFGEGGEHYYTHGAKKEQGGKFSKSSGGDRYGKKGQHGKGHHRSGHKGHKGHHGHHGHHGHESHYAKKSGFHGSKKHGYGHG